MSERAILHVDMDAFYASVEILDNPELKGKPVVVGATADARGVVMAASYEVREFGVHSAMSAYRAKQLCPHAIFVPPRMHRYAEESKKIFRIFHEYTPLVEPLSIDEAFLDVTGCQNLFGPAVDIARTIKSRIKDEHGLTASIGVAPNKFLAKLGSDMEKPDGFVVLTPQNAAARIADLPVGKLWGVGKVAQKKFAAHGINFVRDIIEMPLERLEGVVGSWAPKLRELAQGIDERPVVRGGGSKSVGAESTFSEDIADPAELRHRVDKLSQRVAKRMRAEGYRASTINLKARFANFTTVTRAKTLPEPTSSSQVIRDTARELLEQRLDRGGRAMRLLGVSCSNLSRAEEAEMELFVDKKKTDQEKLDGLMDELQDKYGDKSIRRGSDVESTGHSDWWLDE